MLSSSLRAKRGNPEANAAQSGLPRRVVYPERLQGSRRAPRNDGHLRALASWRETILLFSSREAAKARRHWSAAGVPQLLRFNRPPKGK